MVDDDDRIEAMTRKWWVLHRGQKATRGESDWSRLEGEKDELVEAIAALAQAR